MLTNENPGGWIRMWPATQRSVVGTNVVEYNYTCGVVGQDHLDTLNTLEGPSPRRRVTMDETDPGNSRAAAHDHDDAEPENFYEERRRSERENGSGGYHLLFTAIYQLESLGEPNAGSARRTLEELLKSDKVDKAVRDSFGRTILSALVDIHVSDAIFAKSLEYPAVRSLVDVKDNTGRTPLSWASERNYLGLARLLVESDAEIDSMSNFIRTPLSYAAEHGSMDVMELLLFHGANVDAKDRHETTPLQVAIRKGKREAVELLLGHDAQVQDKIMAQDWGVYMHELDQHNGVLVLCEEQRNEAQRIESQRNESLPLRTRRRMRRPCSPGRRRRARRRNEAQRPPGGPASFPAKRPNHFLKRSHDIVRSVADAGANHGQRRLLCVMAYCPPPPRPAHFPYGLYRLTFRQLDKPIWSATIGVYWDVTGCLAISQL